MTPYNAHGDLLAMTETKPDWVSFSDEVERATDDFMADRVDVFENPDSNLINPEAFTAELKSALERLP